MKHIITIAAMLASGAAFAQSDAVSSSASNAGSLASTGAITFNSAAAPDRVATTPPAYIAPSMMAPGTCGMSDTAAVSITGFGIGGSKSHESDHCNARQDAATAWNLGLQDVARLRFFCYGTEDNKAAYLAAGHQCPDSKQTEVAGYQGNDPIIRARLARK